MKNYLPDKIITYSDIRGTSTDIEDMEQKWEPGENLSWRNF